MKLGRLRRNAATVRVAPVGLRWRVADLGENNLAYIRMVETVLTEGLGRRIAVVAYEMEEPPPENR